MQNIALIVGSTRPNRFADHPAKWIVEGAAARGDIRLDVLDLREHKLPFFNEATPPGYIKGAWAEPAAEAWRQKIAAYDGYIALVAEYNHGPAATLKNAFDSAFFEWQRKPVAFVGYGGVGAARAIEQLRNITVELQMAPLKHEVNISREAYLGVLQGKTLNDFSYLADARSLMFDNLAWWSGALKSARNVATKAA
ncbi:MAG TPA: NAD(P)H-dependent oxidoreductase [Hyphomonadaceae bacterium]|nr:NAD(P)H-dependent oxidoreductase [Hyphomonadaceae bacterium]